MLPLLFRAFVALWLVACAKIPDPPRRIAAPGLSKGVIRCPLEFRFDAKGTQYLSVHVAGEFNDWRKDELELKDPDGDLVYEGSFDLPHVTPGRYAYKLVVSRGGDPEWLLDPGNTRRKVLGSEANSLYVFEDCRKPRLSLIESRYDAASETGVVTAKIEAADPEGFSPETLAAKTSTGAVLPVALGGDGTTATVTVANMAGTKLGVWLEAGGKFGSAEPLYVPMWTRPEAFRFEDSLLYFAFTDRFDNGAPENDAPAACLPLASRANWLGGDFKGVQQKIDAGYFDALGVDAVWISAPNKNPDGCYSGSLGRQYTAYHTYFPVSLDQTDPHFGDAAALRALVDAAHARGIRVLIDFVANHLHEESPLASVHRDWFNPIFLCGWERPITCWFEPYLPDINYDLDAANEAMTGSALHWIRTFDLDGFRVDAAKHIGHPFVHNLRAEIAAKVEHRPSVAAPPLTYDFYMVGETFTGGWSLEDNSQVEMIKEWISPAELSGQFDFPLWYEILYAFGKQSEPTGRIKTFLQHNVDAYGAGARMSSFIDNHDVPRFISHADNRVNGYTPLSDTSSPEAKQIGWDEQLRPGQPTRVEPYRLAAIAYAFAISQSAIPLIYYGDEIGLPGAGDPDNRRMMPWSGYNAGQTELLTRYQRLGGLRRAHPALRSKKLELSGLVEPATGANDDTLAYFKIAPEEEILVLIDRRLDGGSDALPVWLPERYQLGDSLRDLESNEHFSVAARGLVEIPMTRPNVRLLLRVKP